MIKTILPRAAFLLMAGTALANAAETETTANTISDLTFSDINASAGSATVNATNNVSATFSLGSEVTELFNITNKIAPKGKNLQTTGSAGAVVWTLNFELKSTNTVTVNQVVLKLFSCNSTGANQNVNRNGTFNCLLGNTSGTLDKTDLQYITTTDKGTTAGTPAINGKTAEKTPAENIVGIKGNSLTQEENLCTLIFNFETPIQLTDTAVTLAVQGIRPSIDQQGTFAGLAGITLNYDSAIPEPSMFGVLAGLGALALVGARRRRRRS